MRYLENLNDTSIIKHGDSSETLRLSARNDNEPVTWSDGDAATIHVDQVGKQIPAKLVVGSNNVLVDSGDLADLAAGKYGLELWVTLKSGKTAIWPSDGSLEMTIDKNSDEIAGDTVTTITLEDLEKRVDDKISEGLKNIKIDPSQIPSVDLSGYAKKTDVPQVVYDNNSHTLTVNSVKVSIPADVDLSNYATKSDLAKIDLTPYITASAADAKYAAKSDVPQIAYDSAKHTLTINGELVNLPASVDLSDYAKTSQLADYARKDSIPDVALDFAKRTLTLNGVAITIPQQVDLSQYAKSSDVPSVKLSTDTHTLTVDGTAVKIPAEVDLSPYAKSADVDKKIDQKLGSIPAVDLTDYVKKTDLADFVRKTDIPTVPEIKLDTAKRTLTIAGQSIDIPNAVDLSQYAKVDAVPSVALDVEKRTITVNGKEIDVPRDVDLSGYVTKSEMSAEIGKVASGGKIDLTGYVTKADADATYAKKGDIAGMLTKTEADQEYAAKKDVPSVAYNADTKTLTVNGQAVKVPAEIDLSDYAKKSEIPAPVDLTPYVKTSDADVKYAAKKDVPQVLYDKDKKTLTVNGQVVDIPASIDLSGYMKSSDAETEFAKKNDVKNVDLTPYLKSSDADAKYATKSSVPSISYDAAKKQLTVGRQVIDLNNSGSAPNLSQYLTKDDAELTYETRADVDDNYAKKTDVPKITRDNASNSFTVMNGNSGFSVPLTGYTPESRMLNVGQNSVQIPNVEYDKTAKTLKIDGNDVSLSASASGSNDFASHLWFYDGVVNTTSFTIINGSYALGLETDRIESGNINNGENVYDKLHDGDIVIDNSSNVFRLVQHDQSNSYCKQLGRIHTNAMAAPGADTVKEYSYAAIAGEPQMFPIQIYDKTKMASLYGISGGNPGTLDLDNAKIGQGTYANTKMIPGIYQLRDINDFNGNKSIQTKTTLGDVLSAEKIGTLSGITQAVITPYFVLATFVYNDAKTSTQRVGMAWKSIWAMDSSPWFGVTDEWHIMQ